MKKYLVIIIVIRPVSNFEDLVEENNIMLCMRDHDPIIDVTYKLKP